ncbi:MAG: 2-hydroxyglutaryl-CoA dehydratase [Myxococcales bacterium]|nr:2-hydroxyglutaryl-CoA dehydratase [Myxococcales bacterium]
MTQHIDLGTKRSLPVVGDDFDMDAELAKFEAAERERLGLKEEKQWIEDMADLGFTKSEKAKITLLVGGLTMAHDYLVEGGLQSLGYNVIAMDVPDNAALQVGKEFGNRAQCNPTYFTVGNLVKFLIELRDKKGMDPQEIIEKFVFLTAGACGPCRFGMYVTEYRKALRDAGFDGFRVMLFQQQGGLSQATGEESGLEMNPKFFITLVRSLLAGDVINGMAYRIRPYEENKGETDEVVERAKKECYDALKEGRSVLLALRRSRKWFQAIPVDRLRLKPKVAIIGEFWAMTTEGDGNYALQRFVESEGAECDIQFLTAWLLYNIWEVRFDTENRKDLRGTDDAKSGLAELGEYGVFTRRIALYVADRALRVIFHTFARAVGFYDYHLPDMDEVADVAMPFYNNDLRGGEGHMEVGKLILNVVKNKANMTLSVKPFGCMPSSSVSDGVQSLIGERFPGTIFCAVETSGDGAVNFYSRVQMYLFKAKQAAAEEFAKALEDAGLTEDELRAYLAEHPKYANALHRSPHRAGSTATDAAQEIIDRMTTTRTQRVLRTAKGAASWLGSSAKGLLEHGPVRAKAAAGLGLQASAELLEIAKERAPGAAESLVGKVKLRFSGAANAQEQAPLAAE